MAYIKYQRWNGAGDLLNIVDNRSGKYKKFFADTEGKKKLVAESGANGILEILEAPEGEDVAYQVRFHSGLGLCGPVPLCGNGMRCTVGYACTHDIVPKNKHQSFKYLAADGIHDASFSEDASNDRHFVSISMKDIKDVVEVDKDEWFVNCGTAHFVKFVPVGSITSVDVVSEGRRFSKEKAYLAPDLLVLVNFVEDRDDGVFCRCYDTASDFEILACGTASTCIAVIHASYKDEDDGENKKVIGWTNGQITVAYNKKGNEYTGVSLQSKVYCEVKGEFLYES